MVQLKATDKKAVYHIVYCGPASSGKTTNLQKIHEKYSQDKQIQLENRKVVSDNSLSIETMELGIGNLQGVATFFQISAIPGEEQYSEVLKQHLAEADGIVFVADSQYIDQNLSLLNKVEYFLKENDRDFSDVPTVIQWNKRDLDEALPPEQLQREINYIAAPCYLATANLGEGVFVTLRHLLEKVLEKKARKSEVFARSRREEKAFASNIPPEKPDISAQPPAAAAPLEEIEPSFNSAAPLQREGNLEVLAEEVRSCAMGPVVLLKLAGKVDPKSGVFLKAKIENYLYKERIPFIIINLQHIKHFHSTAVGMFIEVANKTKMMGGGICLVQINEKFQSFLTMMRVESFLPSFETENEAINSFSTAPPTTEKKKRSESLPVTKVRNLKEVKTQRSIYICNSQSTQEWANEVFQQLTQNKYIVRKRVSGYDWLKQTIQLISQSDVVLLLWSQEIDQDDLVKHEWLTALNLKKSIIVVTQDEYAPFLPLPLQNAPIVSLEKGKSNMESIFQALQKPRTTPEISFLPVNSYIPYGINPSLHTRVEKLIEIYRKLLEEQMVAITRPDDVTIEGSGKTQLVLEFISKFGFAFESAILWIDAKSDWQEDLIFAAKKVGILSHSWQDSRRSTLLMKLANYLKNHPDTLVILDDVDDFAMVDKELAPGFSLASGDVYLLCTTQTYEIPDEMAIVQTDTFSTKAAYEILVSHRRLSSFSQEKAAKKVVQIVSCSPLLLALVKKLVDSQRLSFDSVLELIAPYREDSAQVLYTILEQQWLKLQNHETRLLLKITGQFPIGQGINIDTLAMLAGFDYESNHLANSLRLLQERFLAHIFPNRKLKLHSEIHYFFSQLATLEDFDPEQLRVESARRLISAFQDFACLEEAWRRRGINEVIDDINLAAHWAGTEEEEIMALHKAFIKESHCLKTPLGFPHFIVQQIYSRIKGENDPETPFVKNMEESLNRVAWSQGAIYFKRLNYCFWRNKNMARANLGDHGREKIQTVCFSSETEQMVSANLNNLRLWNVYNQQQPVISLLEKFANTTCVTFSHDGCLLAANSGNILSVWNVAEQKCLLKFKAHNDWITALSFSSDNSILASASKDHWIKLWRASSGEQLKVISPPEMVNCIRFFPEYDYLLSGSNDRNISIWSLENGEELSSIKAHSAPITTISISPTGEHFLSGSKDGLIKLWNNRGEELHAFAGHRGGINAVSFSPNGRNMLSAGEEGAVHFWDLESGAILNTFIADAPIIECCFNDHGDEIWACDGSPIPTVYHFKIIQHDFASYI